MATLVLRNSKGSPLTFAEVDANFTNLNNELATKTTSGSIVNADINASAAIAHSKLADITAGQVLLGNGSNVPTATALTGDVTINSSGVTAIGGGVIVNADVNASAAIAGTKISPVFGNQQITSTATTGLSIGATYQTNVDRDYVIVGAAKGNTDGTSFIRLVADTTYTSASGGLSFSRQQGANGGSIIRHRGTGQLEIVAQESAGIDLKTTNTQRIRVNSDGSLLLAGLTSTQYPGYGNTTNGAAFDNAGFLSLGLSGNPCANFNRNTSDGSIIYFARDGSYQGGISSTSGTVAVDPFLGAHWGRLEDDSAPDIPVGTVMETVNKIIVWRKVVFSVDGTERWMPWVGPEPTGTTVEFDYNGVTYSGVIEEESDPSGLEKHVCTKVSDTVGSKAVFGVFLTWGDDSEQQVMAGTWPDMLIAAIGNYFVRMDAGETPQIGDYVESAGNGCARVQADDILRASTVAKVTSTIPQRVYDDGSFLVTATLHCG